MPRLKAPASITGFKNNSVIEDGPTVTIKRATRDGYRALSITYVASLLWIRAPIVDSRQKMGYDSRWQLIFGNKINLRMLKEMPCAIGYDICQCNHIVFRRPVCKRHIFRGSVSVDGSVVKV